MDQGSGVVGSPSVSNTRPANAATPIGEGNGPPPQLLSPSKRPAGLQLLGQELALEAVEAQQGLLSPFTSIMGLAVALDDEGDEEEEDRASQGSSSSTSSSSSMGEEALPPLPTLRGGDDAGKPSSSSASSSLLDGVAQALAGAEAPPQQPEQQPEQEQEPSALSPRLSLGEDGFVVTSPPTPATTMTTTAGRPPAAGKPPKKHLRRLSLPSLSAAVSSSSNSASSTPRSGNGAGSGSSGLSLEALKAKLSGRPMIATPPAPAVESGSNGSSGSSSGSSTMEEARLLESARRLGLDISGLRKALLVRVLGVEPLPTATAAGHSSGSNGNGASAKASKRNRSASLGMMPAAWLKRGRAASPTPTATPTAPPADASSPATPASAALAASAASAAEASPLPLAGSGEDGGYVVVLHVLDVESGCEWRVRKSPRDLLALHAVVSALGGGEWAPPRDEDFPLLGGKRKGGGIGGSGAPLSVEKQAKLEKYLRALVGAGAGAQAAAFEAAKVLQDFVGATDRVDVLADAEARGDEAAHLSRLVQLQGLELLRAPAGSGYARRLEAFVREAQACDVHKTELLKAYVALLETLAREMVAEHGPRLKAPLRGGGLLRRGGLEDPEEVDRFCASALWRLLEAETFLPLRLRLYERVMLETDLAQEKALAAKCALFKVRTKQQQDAVKCVPSVIAPPPDSSLSVSTHDPQHTQKTHTQSRPQSFFGINVEHISLSSWETAATHLRRLSGDVTTLPSDKLDVLVAAVREIHALFRREHPGAQDSVLNTDDLLPIFLFVLCQCGIARLLSLKTMLAALGEPARMLAEAGFCLATLEAAIGYILGLDENAGEI